MRITTKFISTYLLMMFFVLNLITLFNCPAAYSQSVNAPFLTVLKGSFGSGEGDVTSTIYVGKDAYDIYFPDNMLEKQTEVINKLIDECSTAKNMMCEIVCLVQLAPSNDEYHGYIKDIKSIKPIAKSVSRPVTISDHQNGPVVFGIYLGMPYEAAVQKFTKEGYEVKYLKVNDDVRNNSLYPLPYTYYILKNGTQVARIYTQTEKGIICGFGLSLILFGVKDYDQLHFAKQFLNYYKIPYSPDMFSLTKGKTLLLTNKQEGYEIEFPSFIYDFVYIRNIQKDSDILFK